MLLWGLHVTSGNYSISICPRVLISLLCPALTRALLPTLMRSLKKVPDNKWSLSLSFSLSLTLLPSISLFSLSPSSAFLFFHGFRWGDFPFFHCLDPLKTSTYTHELPCLPLQYCILGKTEFPEGARAATFPQMSYRNWCNRKVKGRKSRSEQPKLILTMGLWGSWPESVLSPWLKLTQERGPSW